MTEVKEEKIEVLRSSIKGVVREIHTRDQTLRHMKAWYLNRAGNAPSYTIHTLYEKGYRLMREINKLKLIKVELTYLLNINRMLG